MEVSLELRRLLLRGKMVEVLQGFAPIGLSLAHGGCNLVGGYFCEKEAGVARLESDVLPIQLFLEVCGAEFLLGRGVSCLCHMLFLPNPISSP